MQHYRPEANDTKTFCLGIFGTDPKVVIRGSPFINHFPIKNCVTLPPSYGSVKIPRPVTVNANAESAGR
jgi:hypothetical protein